MKYSSKIIVFIAVAAITFGSLLATVGRRHGHSGNFGRHCNDKMMQHHGGMHYGNCGLEKKWKEHSKMEKTLTPPKDTLK